jgi:oligopeptide/dipeptide ABC transporter ATP-binding protein
VKRVNEQVLLEINNLKTYFYTDEGVVPAVDDVSYRILSGETMGLVGESACGKSVTSLSIMQLIQIPPGKIVSGEILFKGENLLKKTANEMRKIRGAEISMIFQEPMTSLNPVFTVGNQIGEAIILHQGVSQREAEKKTVEMLELVGIPSPEKRVKEFPHQMSGGMRQRVMIAMALSCNPDLLIADEPTTALDVTIQAQILELMKSLKDKLGMAILLITHNLAVVAEMADHIAVMYAGKIVEYSVSREVFKNPRHPYTGGLLISIPRLDIPRTAEPLPTIPGVVPSPYNMPKGCPFHPRCAYAKENCVQELPPLEELTPGHLVRCFYPLPLGGVF